jgi:hypothetical protein
VARISNTKAKKKAAEFEQESKKINLNDLKIKQRSVSVRQVKGSEQMYKRSENSRMTMVINWCSNSMQKQMISNLCM